MAAQPGAPGYDPVGLRHPGESSPVSTESSHHEYQTMHAGPSSVSMDSNSPLNTASGTTYPPRRVQIAGDSPTLGYHEHESQGRAAGPGPSMPQPSVSDKMGHNSRNSSWDLLAGFRDFEAGYEHFESRNASEAYLAFAEGDIPQNRFARFYHYLLAASIVTRWTLFIVPVLVLLWIPGILGLTAFPHAAIWGVKLMWWSIWLSVFWGGWWASLATARSLPALARNTVGVVLVGARKYIDWISVLSRYVALFIWTLVSWISFNPLINARQHNATKGGVQAVDIVAKLLFALWIDAAILAAEKFAIQWIAGKFHERSYADRIADQKFAVKVLTLLYRNSRDIPGRTDTLSSKAVMTKDKRMSVDPRKFFKRALKGVKFAATTTTTALGNVASEMTGSSVLQPNSPQAMVQTALQSANKTRLLARRLFYSFQKEGHDYLLVDDIQRFFPARDQADAAFSIFDKDNNGDVTREEMELACLEIHREQLSIEHSMRDLDSAVGRLDNILMSLYVIVAIMLIAIVLDTSLISLVTGAGTLIVALSWLVGDALSEVLSSIIFLFIKHPFDVGDVINLEEDEDTYTVKEIRLLSSILVNGNGALVQAPNVVLNGKFITNVRRSPQMSETFTFDVSYDTTFEQIEDLRARMILFLQGERRDFHPAFDVQVVDIPDQEKMSLKVEIKYKSNWQQGALRAKRRNKWVCMLKTKLAEIPIYGPGGSPDVKPTVSRYTKVPWETVQDEDRKAGEKHPAKERMPTGGWHLSDSNYLNDDSGDIFGDASELSMPDPRRTPTPSVASRQGSSGPSQVPPMPAPIAMPSPANSAAQEYIEMRTPRQGRFDGLPQQQV